jgi:hypothetical protein
MNDNDYIVDWVLIDEPNLLKSIKRYNELRTTFRENLQDELIQNTQSNGE